MYPGGPIATRGQRIGLLGGSFDPPHAGHVLVTERALRTLELDRVWWLVSPRNPLKRQGPAALSRRVAASRQLIRHPRVDVTDIERRLGSRYTADTLARLTAGYPGVRFIWLMGADNLADFHRWQRWDWIARTTPIAVFARPGEQLRAGLSPMARRFAHRRLPPAAASLVGRGGEARWVLLPGPMSPHSSTKIRSSGGWP